MVGTAFTWRYGGREVFLSGSFTGWSERMLMNLIDGSATIFQRIIDLPPGCYQYKFLVDGTWRIDHQKSYELDEYGIMNNIVLVSETELMPNDQAMVSLGSSCHLSRQALQLSDVDKDVFRQVLSMHMLSSTIYELIPNSGKAVIFDVEVNVESAFHVMYKEGLRVVPLWNENRQQMSGMLTSSDFICILLELHSNNPMFSDEDLGRQTISSWKNWKHQHHRDVVGTSVSLERTPLIHVGPDSSLSEVVSSILQNNISAVPVVHSINGSCARLLHVLCLSGVIKHICQHLNHHLGYLTLLQQPVGCLQLGTWKREFQRANGLSLLTLRPNDSLNSALNLLLEAQISAVPIEDERGNIVDTYSRSDIISLAKDNVYTQIQLNHMAISEALEIAREAHRDQLQTCTRSDSLYRVMELLSEPDARRVVVVAACSRRVEGIITLRDVFNFFSR